MLVLKDAEPQIWSNENYNRTQTTPIHVIKSPLPFRLPLASLPSRACTWLPFLPACAPVPTPVIAPLTWTVARSLSRSAPILKKKKPDLHLPDPHHRGCNWCIVVAATWGVAQRSWHGNAATNWALSRMNMATMSDTPKVPRTRYDTI